MIILLLPSKISAFLTIRLLVHAVHADIIFGSAHTADKKKEYRDITCGSRSVIGAVHTTGKYLELMLVGQFR